MFRVNRGLVGYAVAGWACVGMVALALAVLTVASVGVGVVPLLMVLLFFGGGAVYFLYTYYATVRFRLRCLRHHTPCVGRVEGHGRAFTPFSSSRRHTLLVSYYVGDGIRRDSVTLPRAAQVGRYPHGALLEGWYHPDGRAYFPL